MLREKLKSRFLRPLLLLATLLALSQSASAYINYRLVGKLGSADYVSEPFVWNASGRFYEKEISFSDYFHFDHVEAEFDDNSGSHQFYSQAPISMTLTTLTSFPIGTENKNYTVHFAANKKFTLQIKVDSNTEGYAPTMLGITKVEDADPQPVEKIYTDYSLSGNFNNWEKTAFSADGKLVINGYNPAQGYFELYDKTGKVAMANLSYDSTLSLSSGYLTVPNAPAGSTVTISLNLDGTKPALSASYETKTQYGLFGDWNGWGGMLSFDPLTDKAEMQWKADWQFKLYGSNYIDPSDMGYNSEVIEAVQNSSNWNLHLKNAPTDGTTVTFTISEVDGKPYLDATWVKPAVDWSVFKMTGDWNGFSTDSNLKQFSSDGNLSFAVGSQAFKLYTGSWIQPSDLTFNTDVIEVSGANLRLKNAPAPDVLVTFTLSEINGKLHLEATWKGASVSGIPFYPAGITSEAELAAVSSTKKFYYLTGHALNNGMTSPEWEMLDPDGDGIYTLDFTYNRHKTGNDCPVSDADRGIVRVVSFTKADADPTAVTQKSLLDYTLKAGYDQAGVRCRAIYDSNSGSFDVKLLRYTNGTWAEAANGQEATYLPFISLVGSDWKQETSARIGNEDLSQVANTDEGWQNAWIQYDNQGNPVTGRDGSTVYYNTQWPPLNNIYFTTKLTVDGKDYDLTVSSGHLTMATEGEVKTGTEWLKDPRFAAVDFGQGKDVGDHSTEEYILYTVDDMWANGSFKLWSGWNGDHILNTDSNTWQAEWFSNWNWGHSSQSTSATKVQPGKTYELGTEWGDMLFTEDGYNAEPVYLRHVYFFLNREHPNEQYYSRIYTEAAFGGAQISALNNLNDYDCGLMLPEVTNLGSHKVTAVTISVYKDTDPNKTLSEVFTWSGSGVDLAGFNNLFSGFERPDASKNPSNYWKDGFNYEETGRYRYQMDVTFDSGDTETAISNPFYIKAKPAALYTAQLVRVEDGKDGYYVTYAPGATYACKVTSREGADIDTSNGSFLNVERIDVPAAEVYSNPENLWTNKVLIYALPPEGMPTDGSYRGWELYKNSVSDKNLFEDAPFSGDYFRYVAEADALHTGFILRQAITEISEEDGDAEWGEVSDDIDLYIPTPRLLSDLDVEVTIDDDASTFSVTGDDHFGDLEQTDYTADKVEYTARQRHLNLRVPLEKSNATSELLALIKDATPTATFTGSLADQFAGSVALNFESATDILLADQPIRTWVSEKPASKIYCDMNVPDGMTWEEYQQQWWTSDFRLLGKTVAEYTAVPQTLEMKLEAAGLHLYNRNSGAVTLALNEPYAIAPNAKGLEGSMYVANTQPDPLENRWVQRLVLRQFKFNSTGLQPGAFIFSKSDDDSRVEEETIIYENVKAYLEEALRDENGQVVMQDGMPVYHYVETYLDQDANIDHNAHVGFKLSDEHFGSNGTDGRTDTNNAHRYETLTHADATMVIAERELGTWWAGMNSLMLFNENDKLSMSHTFFFKNAPVASIEGASSAMAAPARAARAATVDAFFPAYLDVAVSDDIQTGVQTVTSTGASIVAGEGFIDLMGNEGGVYGIDGTVRYLGNGRIDLSAGVYVVKTATDTLKVIVR